MKPNETLPKDIETSSAENPTSRRELIRRFGLASVSLATLATVGRTSAEAAEEKPRPSNDSKLSLQDQVLLRAAKDPKYRELLLKDPRKGIEMILGAPLPQDLKIEVLQEPADKLLLVLPSAEEASKAGEKTPPQKGELARPKSRWWCCDHDLTCTRKTRNGN